MPESASGHLAQIPYDSSAQPSRREIIHRVRTRLLESFDLDSPTIGYLSGERQIAIDLGNVSRVPIREALTVLRALGIIVVDRERRQYQASTITLGTLGETPSNAGCSFSPSEFDILRRELLGDIRTLSSFIADARRAEGDSASGLVEDLRVSLQAHLDQDWDAIAPPAGIVRINDFVSTAALKFGLGRTSDSIKTHLDILEFSVARERNHSIAEGDVPGALVFEPELVRQRAHGVRRFFRGCLVGNPNASGDLEARVRDFSEYIDCVRATARIVAHEEEEEAPEPVLEPAGFSRVFRLLPLPLRPGVRN